MSHADKTILLPPALGVEIAWALTGFFPTQRSKAAVGQEPESPSNLSRPHEPSQRAAVLARNVLHCIQNQAKEDNEKRYVSYAVAAIASFLRSLDTAYKARELNFEENEALRTSYLKGIQSSIEFGGNLKDHLLKMVPAVTIGGIGGFTIGKSAGNPNESIVFAILGILAGYALGWMVVWLGHRSMGRQYVFHDYQRDLYFQNYTARVRAILRFLYEDLQRKHNDVFGRACPGKLPRMLDGLSWPQFCEYIHKHIAEKKVTPELWPLCETGGGEASEALKQCPHWLYEEAKK